MSNVGPICHIPPSDTSGNPQPVNIPGLPGPVTPNPNNINGTLNALASLLNAMRLMLMMLAGQHGTQGPRGIQGTAGKKGDPASKGQVGRWIEEDRVVTTTRVFQNNDKTSSNWVDVEHVNELLMRDTVTGERWRWDRDRS